MSTRPPVAVPETVAESVDIPSGTVVVLVGAPGAGKSTFAAAHFAPTQILSLDAFRGAVSDDVEDQAATGDALGVMYQVLEARMRRRLTTVLDATHLSQVARRGVTARLARFDAPQIALIIDATRAECQERNLARERVVPPNVVHAMYDTYEATVAGLAEEDFAAIHRVHLINTTVTQVPAATLHPDVPVIRGSGFDVIGDVHGCIDELDALLGRLGYAVVRDPATGAITSARHADPARRLAFVGDLVDRGPDSLAVVRSVQALVQQERATCVQGNHDNKTARAMRPGSTVQRTHGLAETMAQFERELGVETPEWESVRTFLGGLPAYVLLETPGAPTLVLSHAGLNPTQVGRDPKAVRGRCLYGEVAGTTAEGTPNRMHAWAETWTDPSRVAVYGHTPQADAQFVAETTNVDTGCVFGGALTALQWPARRFASVPARQRYAIHTVPAAPEAAVALVAPATPGSAHPSTPPTARRPRGLQQ